jgi:replicative DNA helicase
MATPKKIKTAPSSKEAEMMVLGCMLTSINSLNIAAEALQEDDFYFSEHKRIFNCMKAAFSQDKPADVHLVAEELKRQDLLQEIGGVVYLVELSEYAATSAYIEEYVENVRSLATLRKMIHAAQSIEKAALEVPPDVYQSLDEAQQLLFRIGQTSNSRPGILIKDILQGKVPGSKTPFLKTLEARQERFMEVGDEKPSITGIPSAFIDLDRLLDGLNNSHLIILASRPAMGKTALALNIGENVCFKSRVPVGIFSLEMTAEQLVHRLVCSQSEVESEKIKTGSLSSTEFQHVVEAVKHLEQYCMVIDDQPGLKITDLRARARRMKESYGIGFLIIDYLQLISGSGSSRNIENRQLEISEISRMLKNLARELDIPILCTAQLSRKVEERTGHRPLMSDLRESGSIEQDADSIMFLLRREYYDPHDRPGQAEIILAKNRHGSIGTINLTFRKEIAQFANFSMGSYQIPGLVDEDLASEFNPFKPK